MDRAEMLTRLADPTPEDVDAVEAALVEAGALHFPQLPTGLFPAAGVDAASPSGMQHTWVRDTVHVAAALHAVGHVEPAVAATRALLLHLRAQRERLLGCLGSPGAARIPPGAPDGQARSMRRPLVRFDGRTAGPVPGSWPNAQNDAWGALLWLAARLDRAGHLEPTAGEREDLDLLVRFLDAIDFATDRDHGHWEEAPKLQASSVGVCVAGLRAWRERTTSPEIRELCRRLVRRGRDALDAILPWECREPGAERRADAALLFLLAPFEVVEPDSAVADAILADVRLLLQGERGVRRYRGDSYWHPDCPIEGATAPVADDGAARDARLEPGGEAQWCLFDPLLSTIHGRRLRARGRREDRELQLVHLRRAIEQLTPELRCAELYAWRGGALAPNPHTPLLWTQALLGVALRELRRAVSRG